MKENECKGCIYDLTDRVVTDKEAFNIIMDKCSCCKRAVIEAYKHKLEDLYQGKE